MKTARYLRGSTKQCPKCGSRKVAFEPSLQFQSYGPGLATCRNCKTIWEPFQPEHVWDRDDPYSSFHDPCNNCAFRPGSPEQHDTEKWKSLLDSLKCGAHFYCHKGVPIEPDAEHGFAYPQRTIVTKFAGQHIETKTSDRTKLRFCRGFLNASAALRRAFDRESKQGLLDVLTIVGDPGP